MKTSIQILVSAFLYLTGGVFVHAQSSCSLQVTGNTTISTGGSTTLYALLTQPITCTNMWASWSPSTGLNNPNINNPIASPTVTTQYLVTACCTLNNNLCCDSVSITVTVNPTGLPENNLSNQIHVYPNPFTGSTTLHIDDDQLIPSEFKIYNLLGMELKNYNIQSTEMKIYRDNLSSGLYYYGLFRKGQIVGIGKLMVE